MKKTILPTLLLLITSVSLLAQNLYDVETLRTLHINFENPNWHNQLVQGWQEESGHREVATLQMDGEVYDSVAIRYKGNATFYFAEQNDIPKLPLNIDMNDLKEDQELLGYNKIKLANLLFDPSAIRDVLGAKIYGDYMPTFQANWMNVYVENQYWGVFPNTEAINKPFLKKHFDYKNGVLFKCDPSSQYGSGEEWESPDLAWYGVDSSNYYNRYQLKSEQGWEELVQLIDAINNNPAELENILNVDRAMWYLAVSQVTCNYDSYNGFFIHNYYLYQQKDGLFQILPWDLSELFVGVLLDGAGPVSGNEVYEWDIFNENGWWVEEVPLVDVIANNPIYRKQYLAHIRTLIAEVLNEEELLLTLQNMQAVIADDIANDNYFFFGMGDQYFESNLTSNTNAGGLSAAGIMPSAQKRKAYLNNHPEVSLIPPSIDNVQRNIETPQAGELVNITAYVTNGTQVDLMVSNNGYASFFEPFEMFDDGAHNDGVAGDNVYGAAIPFTSNGTVINYYIRAQNADAMMLNPQRAEYEFYAYTVGQTTAVNELDKPAMLINVSPNPFKDWVEVSILQNLSTRPYTASQTVLVYDVLGKLVDTQMAYFVDGSARINLGGLDGGVYFLAIGEMGHIKVVKE